jgi:DNA polymerase I-like protein with 3'-5' exonuclease and polymerase domains
MALGGSEVPLEDIHDWNVRNLFNAGITREEAKQKFFSWLYDENKTNPKLSKYYDRDKVREMHWDGKVVKTMFGREIEADRSHALNYIIQSTTADLVLRQVIKVHDMLRGMKSFIAFTIHDNIVLDIVDEERYIIPIMIKEFSDTDLGEYLVNVKAGKNFGDLRTLNI